MAIAPYFISLSGFTETSVDQEAESGGERLSWSMVRALLPSLLKDASSRRLRRPRRMRADALLAGRDFEPDENAELLAHECGWIWAVYYTQGKQRTHCVLVHADGTPVAASVARDIIEADLR